MTKEPAVTTFETSPSKYMTDIESFNIKMDEGHWQVIVSTLDFDDGWQTLGMQLIEYGEGLGATVLHFKWDAVSGLEQQDDILAKVNPPLARALARLAASCWEERFPGDFKLGAYEESAVPNEKGVVLAPRF